MFLLMVCDRVTSLITIYSEYTEIKEDINTSGKKEKSEKRK